MGLFGNKDFSLPMTVGDIPAGFEAIQIVTSIAMSPTGALADLAKEADKLGADEVLNVRLLGDENYTAYGDAVKKN